MQIAYREIKSVTNHQVTLVLPEYINSEKVEIIVIPYDLPEMEKSAKVDYRKYFGISNVGAAKIENYLNKVRNEWDRKILD